ncbi:MAG TPA: MarR family transcriptional regulator [Phycisphaerae bacterium]|nr:MarR family transcriptional regulator [Phycisphaerae bacterium]
MSALYEQSRQLFIQRWGEMGANWGISRTMAEIHALLFVSPEPLCTDDVMAQLQVSRGNTSMNLRQLVNWGLISRVHLPGDRKEYFAGENDVWQMFETITRERRRREVEPIIETIERCQSMVRDDLKRLRGAERHQVQEYNRRLTEMADFLNVMNTLFNVVMKAGHKNLARLTKALARLM